MINSTEQLECTTYLNYLEDLHVSDDNKSWITLFKKGKRIMHYNYKYPNLIKKTEEFFNKDNVIDLYVSQNTFFKPERTLESLRYLNALYIDIDYYKTDYRKESVLYFLQKDFFGTKVPVPSYVIDSGRGLYLVWLIERVPSMALNLWKAMEYYLYEQLKEFGADRKALDPTRVLRIIGSINSKSGTEVKVIDKYDYRYDLKTLKLEYLPEVIKKPMRTNKNKGKVIRYFNEFSLYKGRIDDIEKLCEIREYDLEGYREEILFLYRYYNCMELQDNELALEKTIELNSKFLRPLGMNEVIRDTLSAERYSKNAKYKYRTSTIIELLDITSEEQHQLKTLIGKAEKYTRNNEKKRASRRNEQGLTQRQAYKLEKLKAIEKHILNGLDNKAIAEVMNISVRQVQRLRKELDLSTENLLNKETIRELDDNLAMQEVAITKNEIDNVQDFELEEFCILPGLATLNGFLYWYGIPGLLEWSD